MKDTQTRTIIATVITTLILYTTLQSVFRHWSHDRALQQQEGHDGDTLSNNLHHKNLDSVAQFDFYERTSNHDPAYRKQLQQERPKVDPPLTATTRANGVFVMLVRNSDIHSARLTLRQLEDRFNRRYQYPYVFLNDVPFTNEFQEWIRPMSKANMTFATVPKEHWSYPEWISLEKAANARERMKNVIYGDSESYRHMCRYQSGFFYRHEALMPFDYYWRIEPDVEFLCDIDFDPFLYMQENQKKYGFTITMVEYPETIPSLWTTVQEFVEKQPHHLAPDNLRSMISFGRQQKYYNGCHFWTNFELADLRWFRSAAYEAFFEHLDRAGGFFYERWGDAPVHSIAAALLLNKDEIHYFRDIGYKHHPYLNCPLDPEAQLKCHCDPRANINSKPMNGFIGCTRHFLRLTGAKDILSEDMGEDVRDYVYRDGPQDRGNEADNQQPQHQQQGQIIVKFQNRQEHSRAFKNRRGDEAHLPLVPVYQSPERKEFKN